MIATLSHLLFPRPSNNYKAKTLHVSSLSLLMLLIIFSQLCLSFFSRQLPQILGMSATITADELIKLTNQNRQEQGLPVLTVNAVLSEAAQRKGADMIAKNYWAHTAPDGTTPWGFFKDVNYNYLYAGENLARDFLESQAVMDAWMNSPTHRDNILSNRYREIGIAVINDTFQGQPTTLVVQLFGTKASLGQVPKIGQVSSAGEAMVAQMKPWLALGSFHLTKTLTISLTVLLMVLIIIDMVIISRNRVVRLSGRGLAHFIFLGILLLLLVTIQPGLVL